MTMPIFNTRKRFVVGIFTIVLSGAVLFALIFSFYQGRVSEIDLSGYSENQDDAIFNIEKLYFSNNKMFIRGFLYIHSQIPDDPSFTVILRDNETGKTLTLPTFYFDYPDVPAEHQLDPRYSRSGFESVTSCSRFPYKGHSYTVLIAYEDHDEKRIINTGKIIG